MKHKIYIITYNLSEGLNRNLESLFDNYTPNITNMEIYVINNHTNFHLNEVFNNKVTVIHNVLQPDHSLGFLTRNFNQALIHGFKTLYEPQANIVSIIHDDMLWTKNWVERLVSIHEKYNFYTCSWGDAFCSYTVNAVKNIGLWDERFCGIGYQEADYWLRALIYNKEGSSINDFGVNRWINPTITISPTRELEYWDPSEQWWWHNDYVANRPNGDITARTHEFKNQHSYLRKFFEIKWPGIAPEFWTVKLLANLPTKPSIPTYMFYPYFEHYIEGKNEKNYIQ